jgi:hypothetical protein
VVVVETATVATVDNKKPEEKTALGTLLNIRRRTRTSWVYGDIYHQQPTASTGSRPTWTDRVDALWETGARDR